MRGVKLEVARLGVREGSAAGDRDDRPEARVERRDEEPSPGTAGETEKVTLLGRFQAVDSPSELRKIRSRLEGEPPKPSEQQCCSV